jgi:hypothetical protein
LRILDEEDHQEGDYGRARVDDELPSVRVSRERPGDRPNDHDKTAAGKCERMARSVCYGICDLTKKLLQDFPLRSGTSQCPTPEIVPRGG